MPAMARRRSHALAWTWMLIALAACGPRAGAAGAGSGSAADAALADAAPFIVADADVIHVLATDGAYLYWADTAGIRRRPLGDEGAGKVEVVSKATEGLEVTGLVVDDGTLYVADGANLLAIEVGAPPGAEPAMLAEGLGWVSAMTLDDAAVYAATGLSIFKIPRAARVTHDADMVPTTTGGEPVELVSGQTEVTSLAIDDDHLYWTDHDPDPDGGSPYAPLGVEVRGEGAVRRVRRAGGLVETLASGQPSPIGVVVHGGRAWWTTERGVALRSVALDGDRRPRVELPGRATGAAADARGVVVVGGAISGATALYDKVAGAPAEVLAMTDQALLLTPRPPLLAGDWVYAIAQRQDSGNHAILAVPRRARGVTLAVGVDEQALAMTARDGIVYWAETPRDGSGGVSFWRGAPAAGARRRIGRGGGWLSSFTVGPGGLYYAEDSVIHRLPLKGGTAQVVRYTDNAIYALTAHRRHLFWINGTALMTMKRDGGAPFELARNDYGYYGGDSGADLVFDDDYVYTTVFGSGGGGTVTRISERGEVTALWTDDTGNSYPGPQLVRLGDKLYFLAGGQAVQELDTDGRETRQVRSFGGSTALDLAEGNGLLYVLVQRHDLGDAWEVVRITPGEDEAPVVMRWLSVTGGDPPRLAADRDGAYVLSDALGGIVRIAHGAPAVPELARP